MARTETDNKNEKQPRPDARPDGQESAKQAWQWPTAPGFEVFTQAARDNLRRLQETLDVYWQHASSYEDAMYAQARAASQNMAQLANQSIDYLSTLTDEWRKMSREATRQMTDAMTPRA